MTETTQNTPLASQGAKKRVAKLKQDINHRGGSFETEKPGVLHHDSPRCLGDLWNDCPMIGKHNNNCLPL